MHNYFCDHCGAALDPGEICDCKQQPEESERRIVTYADWEAAGDFTKAARPGDYVEERIVDDMRDVPVSPDDIIRYAEGYQRPDIMLRYCASCPVGKKTGKRAVDRDLPWAALRVSQRLQKAKEIADKLESIADDGIVDHMERADFDTALAFLRSLEETITDMLLWAMSRETEKSRPAATETALVK